jgi:uncharacterized membrane protein
MNTLTPLVTVHITAALSAVALGPFALWARLGMTQRPKLHRAFGYAWVTMMLLTATSAIFIKGGNLPNLYGYSPIHLLIILVYGMLIKAFWFLAKGNIRGHKKTMTGLYIGACLVTGALTLLPTRLMNQLVFG